MFDWIPQVNLGNAWKQLTTGKDYDVLGNFSTGKGKRAGQQHLAFVPDVGVRQTPFNPAGIETGGTPTYNPIAAPSPVDTMATASNSLAVDPAYTQRLAQTNRARDIQGRILGRAGEIDSILNDIMSNVDGLLKDRTTKRRGQYDLDSSALISALEAAIPEVQKAFAALGLSSSTFVGDRVDNTNQEYKRSQEAVDTALENDLAGYQSWADSEKGNVRAAADKARNTLGFVRDAEASADNLGRFQESELSFNNALTDFGAQRNNYTTSGDAINKLNSIGADHDFSKILDSFGSLAASSANTGTGGGAAKAVLDSIRGIDPKNKKKLTEAQVNSPVGAASA